MRNVSKKDVITAAVIFITLFPVFAFGAAYSYRLYSIWSQRMQGRAELAKAEFSKKVSIETAKAKRESAVHEASAEIERARGVAEANKIIGDSLKNNEAYLRYLWITGLDEGNQVIYIPTEGNIPIMEAGKR